MSLSLPQQIEALLFYMTEPMTAKKIAKILGTKEKQVQEAFGELEASFTDRGIALIKNEDTVMLGTHPDAHSIIEQLRKNELGKDLTRAAVETLTIVTYRNGITKSEIDYIRGVNSNFILRNLMMRGLVERTPNPADKRSPLYKPTMDTMSYLGITSVQELPDYENLQAKLDAVHEEYTAASEETNEGETEEHIS
jgi:segregation and condensation protein B